jgi:hypothetical protein
VAHSNRCDFGCSIGELCVVFKRPTKICVILGAILVNGVMYLSGPLKWLGFCM